MLSEHVRVLHIWKDKDHYDESPELDDFDLQSIQNDLEVAYKWMEFKNYYVMNSKKPWL